MRTPDPRGHASVPLDTADQLRLLDDIVFARRAAAQAFPATALLSSNRNAPPHPLSSQGVMREEPPRPISREAAHRYVPIETFNHQWIH